jgi:predicted HTH domain antitoxin
MLKNARRLGEPAVAIFIALPSGRPMSNLHLELPEELLHLPGQTQATLQQLGREALLVRLYEMGLLSSGRAAEMLRMSRREFLDLLGRYHVSIFDEGMDLEAEARRGR